MQSNDTTPRFRNLSINGLPPIGASSFSFSENTFPANGCFMCRQANIYLNPIGMQRERSVARRYPPPLSRAQIEELSQKKHLTKREVRLLLQCYFPEIKDIKYFQLHKFHSCCYDPKHMNLCKNHITALQHERADHGHHALHKHKDEDHFREYERDGGYQNRVSFVRIKIEPTKGIPTRFLGPTALPASLADMLIKQVNRYENKKRPATFTSETRTTASMYNRRRFGQSTRGPASTVSEYLGTLDSDDDDDDDDEEEEEDDDEMSITDVDEDEFGVDTYHPNTAVSNIYGYYGKSRDHSRSKHGSKLRTISEKTSAKAISSINGDLMVEEVEELSPSYVQESPNGRKKRRRRRSRKPVQAKPKVNHWEELALKQASQDPCGCRHHVRRRDSDHLVYDWCRCKDHSHRDLKVKSKTAFRDQLPPMSTRTVSPPPEKSKVRKRKSNSKKKTEMALAYDPTAIDYDVIQEVLYFRTNSGRLIKPEISTSFAYNDALKARGLKVKRSTVKDNATSISSKATPREVKSTPKTYLVSVGNSPIVFSPQESLSNDQPLSNGEHTASKNQLMALPEPPETPIIRNEPMYATVDSDPEEPIQVEEYKEPVPEPVPELETVQEYVSEPESEPEEVEEETDDDDGANEVLEDFIAPKYVSQNSNAPVTPSASLPIRMQKSSKPTFKNHHPTPNVERESSIVANRRWYDQALGDQNLLTVHDGQFGLIAGPSVQEHQAPIQLPLNDYPEADIRTNQRGGCRIS